MNNRFEKEFNLGGSIEKALTGDYQLNTHEVIKEAFTHTFKHFWSFVPAILILSAVNFIIIFVTIRLQVADLGLFFQDLLTPEKASLAIWQTLNIAKASSQIISAPLYAGTCLMAMSHAAGLKTQTQYMTKGLQFTIPLIVFATMELLINTLAGWLYFPLSLYVTIVFSQTMLLICEKRVPVIQAMLLSFKGINRKLLPILSLYLIVFSIFILVTWLCFINIIFVIGLLFVLPLYLHVNGIIYRNMFGIKLVLVSNSDDNDPKVFNA